MRLVDVLRKALYRVSTPQATCRKRLRSSENTDGQLLILRTWCALLARSTASVTLVLARSAVTTARYHALQRAHFTREQRNASCAKVSPHSLPATPPRRVTIPQIFRTIPIPRPPRIRAASRSIPAQSHMTSRASYTSHAGWTHDRELCATRRPTARNGLHTRQSRSPAHAPWRGPHAQSLVIPHQRGTRPARPERPDAINRRGQAKVSIGGPPRNPETTPSPTSPDLRPTRTPETRIRPGAKHFLSRRRH